MPATSSPATIRPALPTTRPRFAADTSMIDAIAASVAKATPFFSSSEGCLTKACIAASAPKARRPAAAEQEEAEQAQDQRRHDDRPGQPDAEEDGREDRVPGTAAPAADQGPAANGQRTHRINGEEKEPHNQRWRRCRRRTRRLMCNRLARRRRRSAGFFER